MVIKKGNNTSNSQQKKELPKYTADDFWETLEKILLRQHSAENVKKIMQQYHTVSTKNFLTIF